MTASSDHEVVHPPIHYVGTPVMFLCTENEDGSTNLAPASSYWALGDIAVLGLETSSRTSQNLVARGEITVSFPSPDLVPAIEAIGNTTGVEKVPADKEGRYTFVKDKFALAHLTPQPSTHVRPPRVLECELQLEGRLLRATSGVGDYLMAEVAVVAVHARPHLIVAGTQHIDPRRWQPTIYSYRHYFGLGDDRGHRPSSPLRTASSPATSSR